jgi:two-component system phosphate regulon sensor histidine kinase PhoR
MNLVFPIKSADGEIHGFLVLGSKKSGSKFTIEDIDLLNAVISRIAASIDRIKLQEELILERVESERLDELNRMKSYFISSVSHDMKTPLTSIKMFAELLQTSTGIKSEKSKEYLEIIEGESSRLSRLIDNVLDFSKIEKGIKQYNFENIRLNEIVDHTLKLMQYQFKLHKFDVGSNLTTEEKPICADKDAVEEALINLLSNSLKFSGEKKNIQVSTHIENKYMVLTVEDEGIGISEKDIDNIFNPFFRIESKEVLRTGGAGLGLAVIKYIMDAHKGKIEVESEPGKGSRFRLLFPIK